MLPQVVQEGQRILNEMQDIFKLFLTRILYVALLILSSLASGGFPLEPKNSSILTLLTVGIPTIALTAWAAPGTKQQTKVARRISHFVLPAGLSLALFGLVIFVGSLIVPGIISGGFNIASSLEPDSVGVRLETKASFRQEGVGVGGAGTGKYLFENKVEQSGTAHRSGEEDGLVAAFPL